jgi:hypothetical protein
MVLAAAAMIATAVTLPTASLAASKTTVPGKYVLLFVLITDQRTTIGKYGSSANHDGLIPVPDQIPRGDIMSINVLNRSKQVTTFSVFGKKTPPLKPGAKAHLSQAAMVRGSFLWTQKTGQKVLRRGYITVF